MWMKISECILNEILFRKGCKEPFYLPPPNTQNVQVVENFGPDSRIVFNV